MIIHLGNRDIAVKMKDVLELHSLMKHLKKNCQKMHVNCTYRRYKCLCVGATGATFLTGALSVKNRSKTAVVNAIVKINETLIEKVNPSEYDDGGFVYINILIN